MRLSIAPSHEATVVSRRRQLTCLPRTPAVAQPPSPGLQVTQASNKVLLRKTVWGGALMPGGRRCEHGLYMDAPAQLRVVLPKPATRLTALVGIGDNPDSRPRRKPHTEHPPLLRPVRAGDDGGAHGDASILTRAVRPDRPLSVGVLNEAKTIHPDALAVIGEDDHVQ